WARTRLPGGRQNWLRTAGVAATTSDPSGSGADVPSTSSLPAGSPFACSARHIPGAQETIALPATCPAIQAAAWARGAVAPSNAPGALPPEVVPRAGADTAAGPRCVMISAPTIIIRATAAIANAPRARAIHRRAPPCLSTHSRTVVAITVGQEG